MEPQTVTELRWYLARINSAFNEAIKYRAQADTDRLQALIDLHDATRAQEKTLIRQLSKKAKKASEAFLEADKALMAVHKQKIHLETELEHMQERKEYQWNTHTRDYSPTQ